MSVMVAGTKARYRKSQSVRRRVDQASFGMPINNADSSAPAKAASDKKK